MSKFEVHFFTERWRNRGRVSSSDSRRKKFSLWEANQSACSAESGEEPIKQPSHLYECPKRGNTAALLDESAVRYLFIFLTKPFPILLSRRTQIRLDDT